MRNKGGWSRGAGPCFGPGVHGGRISRLQLWSAVRPPAFPAFRQRSEQWVTFSQSRSHFLRQVKGSLQTTQVLVGRSDFLRIFGMVHPAVATGLSPDRALPRTACGAGPGRSRPCQSGRAGASPGEQTCAGVGTGGYKADPGPAGGAGAGTPATRGQARTVFGPIPSRSSQSAEIRRHGQDRGPPGFRRPAVRSACTACVHGSHQTRRIRDQDLAISRLDHPPRGKAVQDLPGRVS